MDQSSDILERIQKIRNDPVEFLKAVRTLDQVDLANPIKTFPWEREYIQLFVRIWQKKKKILVPKSRRMTMSWTCISLATWDVMFHFGKAWAFVSKKEDDSDELVKRAKFIVENLDPTVIPKDFIPKFDAKYCELKFPELNSSISGFASGADQLRQFTFSGILGDEMAFWDDAEKMYSASKPTIEGKTADEGGKFIGISSAAPGFFKRLVFDQLDEAHDAKNP